MATTNATSGDSAEVAIQKLLTPPRAGGQAPDRSRVRSFADVLHQLPDAFFQVYLMEKDPAQRASEYKVVVEWFTAANVRPPTQGELKTEWQRRQDSAKTEGGVQTPTAGGQGRAQAAKRFGGTK